MRQLLHVLLSGALAFGPALPASANHLPQHLPIEQGDFVPLEVQEGDQAQLEANLQQLNALEQALQDAAFLRFLLRHQITLTPRTPAL